MINQTQNNTAWGVEFGASTVRLVRVARTAAGYRIERCLTAPLEARWAAAPDLSAVAGILAAEKPDGALAACVADELVLFRSLALPDASDEALRKMVHSQLEVLIPTQSERFATGFRTASGTANDGARRVLLCAARKDALATAGAACERLGGQAGPMFPSILALATTWRVLAGVAANRPTVLLDVGARCTSLAVVRDRDVLDCGVVDHGSDQWTERIARDLEIACPEAEKRKLAYSNASDGAGRDKAVGQCLSAAMDEWAGQLREAYQHCIDGVPQQHRPERCVLFGRAARTAGLVERVARTLGVEVEFPSPNTALMPADGVELDQAAAASGAAIALLEDDAPVVNLTGTAAPKARRSVRRLAVWAALAAWLLAALLTLYGLDRGRYTRTRALLADMKAKVRDHNLDREASVGAYLSVNGTSPLELMARVSDVLPKNVILSRFECRRDGSISLSGTAPNVKDYVAIVSKLKEIGAVEPKSGRPDKKKFLFEIALTLGPPPPATQPATKPADKAKAASKPTGKATSKPTTAATTKAANRTPGKAVTKPAEQKAKTRPSATQQGGTS